MSFIDDVLNVINNYNSALRKKIDKHKLILWVDILDIHINNAHDKDMTDFINYMAFIADVFRSYVSDSVYNVSEIYNESKKRWMDLISKNEKNNFLMIRKAWKVVDAYCDSFKLMFNYDLNIDEYHYISDFFVYVGVVIFICVLYLMVLCI